MKRTIVNVVAGMLIGLALATALLPPAKYGTFGDNITCGQNTTLQYRYIFLSYHFTSSPIAGQQLRIGTCPYENYYVKSYSLDVVALAGALLYFNNRPRKHKSLTA